MVCAAVPAADDIRDIPVDVSVFGQGLREKDLPAGIGIGVNIFSLKLRTLQGKVVLTFNYSGDRRTITLKEIDAGLQQGIRIPCAVVHQEHPENMTFSGCFLCLQGLFCGELKRGF